MGQEEESYKVSVKVSGGGGAVKVKIDGEDNQALEFEVVGPEGKKVNLSLVCDLEFIEKEKMDDV